jgi:hypothetical protein
LYRICLFCVFHVPLQVRNETDVPSRDSDVIPELPLKDGNQECHST